MYFNIKTPKKYFSTQAKKRLKSDVQDLYKFIHLELGLVQNR